MVGKVIDRFAPIAQLCCEGRHEVLLLPECYRHKRLRTVERQLDFNVRCQHLPMLCSGLAYFAPSDVLLTCKGVNLI
jgi:hypothetical protein